VGRSALVDSLFGAEAQLMLMCAPAGYGKTTLLAEWARVEPRPITRYRSTGPTTTR
jgi:ATP/maltotriose-dependent transcriptional regulator MalT